MAVNGGAGNAISFSEIQTFYGGSNPIDLSDYYRAASGTEVPNIGTVVAAAANQTHNNQTPGSAVTRGNFDVTVIEGVGSPTTASVGNSVTVLSTTSRIVLSGNGSGTVFFTRITAGGSTIGLGSFNIGGDGDPDGPIGFAVKGPNYDSADGSVSNNTTFNAGDSFSVSGSGAASGSGGSHVTRPDLFDISFKNTNSNTLTTTSGSAGGAQTYTQNQTRTHDLNLSSNSYTLGHDIVQADANTNIPTSGTVNIDAFNAPGNPVA